ncbi:conserved hypothetical protein [Clostridium neonatale]|uniref:hypothetical protein n=1 Tax=Clostridium neonatale TaxID=137838 RepID=UPI00291BA8E7|nr:hypothetical protein [Clostridium neonatale]CAI3534832.1 conserved hypothetical protein [Clostridium neonatale]CAI3586630.1 conserved hypothetical protein [Clostridium neonatale]
MSKEKNDCMNIPKFKFDSNLGLITIDGKRMDTVKEIKIETKASEGFSTVTLKFDANVEVEGDLLILPSLIGRTKLLQKIREVNK